MIYVEFENVLFIGNTPIPGAVEFMDDLTAKSDVTILAAHPDQALKLLDKYSFRYSKIIPWTPGPVVSVDAIPCVSPDDYSLVIDAISETSL